MYPDHHRSLHGYFHEFFAASLRFALRRTLCTHSTSTLLDAVPTAPPSTAASSSPQKLTTLLINSRKKKKRERLLSRLILFFFLFEVAVKHPQPLPV